MPEGTMIFGLFGFVRSCLALLGCQCTRTWCVTSNLTGRCYVFVYSSLSAWSPAGQCHSMTATFNNTCHPVLLRPFGNLNPYHLGNTKFMGMLIDKAFWSFILPRELFPVTQDTKIVWCRGCSKNGLWFAIKLREKKNKFWFDLGGIGDDMLCLEKYLRSMKDSIVEQCGFCVSREAAMITTEWKKRSVYDDRNQDEAWLGVYECWLVGANSRRRSLSMIAVFWIL